MNAKESCYLRDPSISLLMNNRPPIYPFNKLQVLLSARYKDE